MQQFIALMKWVVTWRHELRGVVFTPPACLRMWLTQGQQTKMVQSVLSLSICPSVRGNPELVGVKIITRLVLPASRLQTTSPCI